MAHDKITRNKARAKYIQGLPLAGAADAAGVAHPTVRNWKRDARANGDDWDLARAAKRTSAGNLQDQSNAIMEDMCGLLQGAMDAIKSDTTISPLARAEAVNRLADAYTKSLSAAGRANPKLGRLAVGMEVIEGMTAFVREHKPAQALEFLALVEEYAPRMAAHFSS